MDKVVEIRSLDFSYPDGGKALKGINLDIHREESVAVIGPNGAGKSTLLLHLNGLLEGSAPLKIFNMPICKKNIALIRQKVGFVFQDSQDQLFMPTVYEDVAFGPQNSGLSKEEVARRVEFALGEVGLLDKKSFLSHHLSLGEQKRVSIATVLSMSPELLVLDEPNSNLDSVSRRNLIDLLRAQRITKIIATHDLEMVLELCSRVVLLDKGRLICEGQAREVLSNKTLLEAHGLEVPLSISLSAIPRVSRTVSS